MTTGSPGPAPSATPCPPVDPALVVADLDRRFYAFALDRCVAWGITLAVVLVARRYLLASGNLLLGVAMVGATVATVGAASAAMLGTTGRTPGRALLGLRVVRAADGRPLGVRPAVLRTLMVALATVPFGFGLAFLAWTAVADPARQRRGWHDQLLGSMVVGAPAPVVQEPRDSGTRHLVNLTAARLVPARGGPPGIVPVVARTARERTAPQPVRPAAWWLAFDTGERVAVDTLVLIGHRPEAGAGEEGARLVSLSPDDGRASSTYAQVVVASDGALVVTGRSSTYGSVLVRRGVSRPLTPGRPSTLLDGDLVTVAEHAFTVVRRG